MKVAIPEVLSEKCICFKCVDEPYLKNEIQLQGERRNCSYCHKTAKTYTLDEIADKMHEAMRVFYERTSDEPSDWEYLKIKEFGDIWIRDGEDIVDVIGEAAGLPREAAEDIQQALEEWHSDFDLSALGEESEYARGSCYASKVHDDSRWREKWDRFEWSVKHEARFFNAAAKEILLELFEGLDQLRTHRGTPVIRTAGPGTDLPQLYRARMFTTPGALHKAMEDPIRQFGPPPPKYATAGRMNSQGVAVFYGATDRRVAISEVRPVVGSKVVVAAFEFTRPVRLLDLEALTSLMGTGSIFDPVEFERREKLAFLRKLTRLLTTPVMPGEEELEYLPTQAVADFLAEKADPAIDGLQFRSVQFGGKGTNIVLFHKSSTIAPLGLAPGTKLEAELGFETEEYMSDYSISEVAVKKKAPGMPPAAKSLPMAVLRLNRELITVHDVQAISFVVTENAVQWNPLDETAKFLDEDAVFGS